MDTRLFSLRIRCPTCSICLVIRKDSAGGTTVIFALRECFYPEIGGWGEYQGLPPRSPTTIGTKAIQLWLERRCLTYS
jgi:hypothetical protein